METLRRLARETPVTLVSWLAAIVGIVLVRTMFEQFSSPQPDRFPLIDLPTLVHYTVFYIAAVLSIVAILVAVAKVTMKEAMTLGLFGMLIIWTPPLIDLVASGGNGHEIAYLFLPFSELITRYITFFGGHISTGITLGIQIEVALIVLGVCAYVRYVTQKTSRALLAAFLVYTTVFILLAVPSLIIALLPGAQVGESTTIGSGLYEALQGSMIGTEHVHPSFNGVPLAMFDLGFNKLMTQVFLLVSVIALFVTFFTAVKSKLVAVVCNSRPERIAHYVLLFVLGLLLGGGEIASWVDLGVFMCAVLAFIFAWMFSVCENDIEDLEIDVVSNDTRPLVVQSLTKTDMSFAAGILFVCALLFAYAASHYVFFFVAMFILLYHNYSVPPLRLKRVPILSSFIIGLACLAALLAGFFLFSTEKHFSLFPVKHAVLVVVVFAIAANVRDIKDVEGDRKGGIRTLPTMLGLTHAKKLIGFAISVMFLLVPWYMQIHTLIIPSVIAATLSWTATNARQYKEWRFFAVYLSYALVLVAMMF